MSLVVHCKSEYRANSWPVAHHPTMITPPASPLSDRSFSRSLSRSLYLCLSLPSLPLSPAILLFHSRYPPIIGNPSNSSQVCISLFNTSPNIVLTLGQQQPPSHHDHTTGVSTERSLSPTPLSFSPSLLSPLPTYSPFPLNVPSYHRQPIKSKSSMYLVVHSKSEFC